jgi:hypothetical protein
MSDTGPYREMPKIPGIRRRGNLVRIIQLWEPVLVPSDELWRVHSILAKRMHPRSRIPGALPPEMPQRRDVLQFFRDDYQRAKHEPEFTLPIGYCLDAYTRRESHGILEKLPMELVLNPADRFCFTMQVGEAQYIQLELYGTFDKAIA